MREMVKARLERAFGLTGDLLGGLEEGALGLDLGGMPSNRIGGQAWCVVGARESYARAIEAGEWRGFACSLAKPREKAAVMAALESSARRVGEIEFGGLGERQLELAMDLLEHEVQHHGQLIRLVYANGLGFPGSWRERWTV